MCGFWSKISVVRIFALFLCVSFSGIGLCQFEAIQKAHSKAEFERAKSELHPLLQNEPRLQRALEPLDKNESWTEGQRRIVNVLEARKSLLFQSKKSPAVQDASATTKDILSSPAFHQIGQNNAKAQVQESKPNPAVDAFLKFIEWIFTKIVEFLWGKRGVPPTGAGAGLNFLTPLVWIVVIVGLIIVTVLVVLRMKFGWKFKRKVQLISEEEVDLSADEWLRKALQLESNLQYREAVRCLYLASLVRMDENRILRFVHSETNWEHYYRYQGLEHKLEGIDLREITQKFDQVWYGFRVRGTIDVDEFKQFYERLLKSIHVRSQAS